MLMVYKQNLGPGENTFGPVEVSDVAFEKVWRDRGWEEAPATDDDAPRPARSGRAKKNADA